MTPLIERLRLEQPSNPLQQKRCLHLFQIDHVESTIFQNTTNNSSLHFLKGFAITVFLTAQKSK